MGSLQGKLLHLSKRKIKENHNYQQNCTIFDAPYYWADSSEKNARDYLKNFIDHAKLISGQEQVDIIAHSMGGIVTRSYIQNEDLYENDVHKFAMVGTPNQGSPLAYFIWENGNPRRADFNGIVSSPSNFILPNTFFYTNSLINFHKEKRGGTSPCITNRSSKNSFRLPVYCNNQIIKNFVQSSVPGLKDLLPSYDGALNSSVTQ